MFYPTMRYIDLFLGLWLWRYTRLIGNIISAWTCKPVLPPRKPTLTTKDVTVVIPTLGENKEFVECVKSINACNPAAITVVTPEKNVNRVQKILDELKFDKISLLGAKKANKRLQMVQGLKESKSAITIFADDDVFWGTSFITYLLAPFEDPQVGAVGGFTSSSQTSNLNVWEFLGTAYLERWNFEIAATSHMDGGLSCLSGRTAAIRTKIAQDPAFIDDFIGEKWIGQISLLSADDDNCITRWLVNNGWKIAIQTADEARLTTHVEPDSAFLGQCVRWCRTTWRSNFTAMFLERVIWREQPWCCYALYLSFLNPPALVYDGLLGYILYQSVLSMPADQLVAAPSTVFAGFLLWLLFTKTVKLWPHFYRHPDQIKFIPALVLFGYFHGLLKLYCLLTLHKTAWSGGRFRRLTQQAISRTALMRGSSQELLGNMYRIKQVKPSTQVE